MIPVKLRVRNFMSYGEMVQELDFKTFRLLCLTGENGAGKSSLLEAIPWAIWGEARSKNINLIRQGAKDGVISFEFLLHERAYRIIRTMKNSSTANHTVDFSCKDELGNWKSISQGTIKDTQKRIEATIGINYDTFKNTCFFEQGKADVFMQKKPSERKELLADVLQINQYEQYAKRAKEKTKECETQSREQRIKREYLQKEVECKPQIEQEQTTIIESLREKKNELQKQIDDNKKSEKELNELQEKSKQCSHKEQERDLRKEHQKKYQKELSLLLQEKETLNQILSQKTAIEKSYHEIQAIKKEVESLEGKRNVYGSLFNEKEKQEREKIFQENLLSQKRNHIEESIEKKKNEFENIKKEVARINSIKQTIVQKEKINNALEERISSIEKKEQDKHSFEKQIGSLSTEIEILIAEKNKIEQKGKEIKSLQSSECPLCKSELTETHRKEILEEYRKEYKEIEAAKLTKETSKEKLLAQVKEISSQVNSLPGLRKEKSEKEKEIAIQKEQYAQLGKLVVRVVEFQSEIDSLISDLEKTDGMIKQSSDEFEKQIAEIVKKTEHLAYNESRYDYIKKEITALDSIEKKYFELTNAEETMNKLQTKITGTELEVAVYQTNIISLEKEINDLKKEIVGKSAIEKKLTDAKELERTIQNDIAKLKATAEQLKLKIDDIKRKEEEITELILQEKQTNKEKDLYDLLQKAFDKDGIQSFLVREAIPHLEKEANIILSQLTKNNFTLNFDYEEINAKGEVKGRNDIEILIVDGTGNRRLYETFSGGEKFKVDFSLRIALSKLLAHQHNFSIQMLVIDEGFGTQDDDGLEALEQALKTIEGDFEKIILITHIDKMKNSFDDRMIIEKTIEGSKIILN